MRRDVPDVTEGIFEASGAIAVELVLQRLPLGGARIERTPPRPAPTGSARIELFDWAMRPTQRPAPADDLRPLPGLVADAVAYAASVEQITGLGDWTNAGRVSADVTIEEVIAPLPKREFKGKIAVGEQQSHTVTIPPGTPEVTFRLSWSDDWGAYPTNDLDMLLFGPGGVTNFAGATLNSPETVTIQNPAAGTWTIVVDGFAVFGKDDKYEIRVDY